MKKIVLAMFLLFSMLVFGCTPGTTTGGAALKLTNPIKRCRMVDVPYEATEQYQVSFKYEVVGAYKDTTLKGLDVWAISVVKVRNVDTETGLFTVEQTFSTLNRGSQALKSTHYIMSGETKEFVNDFDINLGEDFNVRYSVIPPKKTLTRTVTKYRKEERCD